MKHLPKTDWPHVRNALLCSIVGIGGLLLLIRAISLLAGVPELLTGNEVLVKVAEEKGLLDARALVAALHGVVGVWLLAACGMGIWKRGVSSLKFLRGACVSVYVFTVVLAALGAGLLAGLFPPLVESVLAAGGEAGAGDGPIARIGGFLFWRCAVPYGLLVLSVLFAHLQSWRRPHVWFHTGEYADQPLGGDRALAATVRALAIDWPRFRNLVLCLFLGIGGMLLVVRSAHVPLVSYPAFLAENDAVAELYRNNGMGQLLITLAAVHLVVGVWMLLAFSLGLLRRRRFTLKLTRSACGAAYAVALLGVYGVARGIGLMYGNEVHPAAFDFDKVIAFFWFSKGIAPYALLALSAGLVHLHSWRRAQINLYTGETVAGPAPGDRALEALRTHGRDPQYRRSVYGSFFLHALVILIIPWLLQWFGCVEDYRVPKGRGRPAVAQVKMVQKKKKKKKLILNPESAIVFNRPDIEELLKEVEKQTELTYKATTNAQSGKMGAGDGDEGGWPDGMENAVVRFIRLKYRGSDWDDGMDAKSRADMNFLERFHKLTGFKIRNHSEAHRIHLLRKYRPGYAPPFVYMTGNRGIHVGGNEIKILRDYLLNGGMLFADCGGPAWHGSFKTFIKRVLPGKEMVVISDDDPLFQMPYQFPNGAPPLWHHGGMRALGIKHQGRWCVFYHPGDINDAWKEGHSGLSQRQAEHAFQMGINIVYYSFTHYLELTRKYRK